MEKLSKRITINSLLTYWIGRNFLPFWIQKKTNKNKKITWHTGQYIILFIFLLSMIPFLAMNKRVFWWHFPQRANWCPRLAIGFKHSSENKQMFSGNKFVCLTIKFASKHLIFHVPSEVVKLCLQHWKPFYFYLNILSQNN